MIGSLAGGVGAARFLQGLVKVIDPKDLVIVVNTADDLYLYGLYISPDLDTIMYNMAAIADKTRGWGIQDDTYHCIGMLERYGNEPWFKLGDKDFATHILRTHLLRKGIPLSEVTSLLTSLLGIETAIYPMSNQKVSTRVVTPNGVLDFQDYFVRQQETAIVNDIYFEGLKDAAPPPGLLEVLDSIDGFLIGPSNPIVSIQPILKIPGILPILKKKPVVGISPIVGGLPIKGPADKLMRAFNIEVSPYGVAKYYSAFLNTLIIDNKDAGLQQQIEDIDIHAVATNTIMRTIEDKIALAKIALQELDKLL